MKNEKEDRLLALVAMIREAGKRADNDTFLQETTPAEEMPLRRPRNTDADLFGGAGTEY